MTLPADPAFNDGRADTLAVPGSWDRILDKNDDLAATFWLRKKFAAGRFPAGETLVLYLGNFGIADRAYINGTYVGGLGSFPSKGNLFSYKSAWHRERVYEFPSSLLKQGAENVVAVKVFSHAINGTGSRPLITTLNSWNQSNWINEYLPPMGGLNPVFLSFLLVILLVIIVEGSVDRKTIIFSITFILSVFILILALYGLPGFDDNRYRFKLFFAGYAFADFVLLLLLQEFFNIKPKFLTLASSVMLAGIIAFIIYSPTNRYLFLKAGSATVAVVSMYIISALSLFIIALYRDPRRYWFLVIWAVFILASAANTLYGLAVYRFYAISFSFALRLPILLFGAVIVYLIELKNIKKERDSLTQALLKKTREVQRLGKAAVKNESRAVTRDVIQDLVEYLDNNYSETYDRTRPCQAVQHERGLHGASFQEDHEHEHCQLYQLPSASRRPSSCWMRPTARSSTSPFTWGSTT